MVIAAAAVGCLTLLPVTTAQGTVPAFPAAPRPDGTYSLGFHPQRLTGEPGYPHQLIAHEPAAGCQQKLDRAQRQHPGVPALAVVGASFTAGVGPGNPGQSWAVVLTRQLRWDAVIYGDPGAGYVRAGVGRKGPVAAEIARLDLRALAPALVIVQAGHDDIGVPPGLERRRVEQAVALIHAEAPRARIALLAVFAERSRSPAASLAAYRTDQAIVTAGRAADRNVIIIDPLAAGWTYPRSHDGLHPSARGDAWIASQVAGILRAHGVRPAPQSHNAAAVICDWSITVPAPHR